MSTITTINAGDNITDSRAVINTNFANLNTDKIETSVIDTDTTLAANSDARLPSQKAVKAYVDAGGSVASETSAGRVEESTVAEIQSGASTGGTGAKLFITPEKYLSFMSGFGDGSDGALSISSGTTTLASDKQYTSITISGTAILDTAGYKIYVQGAVSVDASSGACIRNNGGTGGNASGATGGAAGSAGLGVTLPSGTAGAVGADGRSTSGNGANGNAGSNKTLSIGVLGIAGGAGGNASGGRTGGTSGGAGTVTGSNNKLATLADTILIDTTSGTLTFVTGSAGSGSGGAGANDSGLSTSGGGGGAGGSGGCVFIAAKTVSLTGSGAIQAKGGAGGTGAAGSGSVANGGGGGGGGGAGGQVILIYRAKTGAGTIDVSGGAGGAGGAAGGGSSSAGATGSTGTTGKTYLIQV